MSSNWNFLKGSGLNFGLKLKFLLCVFLGKNVLEIVFGEVLNRKQAFLWYKNINFLIVTKFDFSKEAVHDFGQKFEISSLYFGKIGLEVVFGDILDMKQAFLNCKNIDLDRG